ncbi:MAG: Bax inhibitor-1/YccA family protein [Kangiellaceae bacterium]|jgi:modulator of FtsH protease|nr:Bax inhibitor-1/YccA family protein [Kangiellaceae bacterium]
MENNTNVIDRGVSSALEINKVLKNTYLLLSATLLFSAAMAGVSMVMNVTMLNPFIWLAAAFGLLFAVHKTADSAAGLFWVFAFTGWFGFWAGPIVGFYVSMGGAQIVVQALAGTGLIFFALSGYVLTTKKDFSFMRGILMTGIMVLFFGSLAYLVANYFFGVYISGLSLAFSGIAVLLFSAFILYDTSNIIQGLETNYIRATVSMYLNIYNLFMNLLHLIAALSGED